MVFRQYAKRILLGTLIWSLAVSTLAIVVFCFLRVPFMGGSVPGFWDVVVGYWIGTFCLALFVGFVFFYSLYCGHYTETSLLKVKEGTKLLYWDKSLKSLHVVEVLRVALNEDGPVRTVKARVKFLSTLRPKGKAQTGTAWVVPADLHPIA